MSCDCKTELVKAEYESLRSEIDSAKTRLFKLFLGGISLPFALLAILVKFPNAMNLVLIAMPVMILAIYFRYQYERKVISRAGQYIKEKIEPNSDGNLGWEAWLSSSGNNASARTPLTISFKLISAAYYFAPAILKFHNDYSAGADATIIGYILSNWLFLLFYGASVALWYSLINNSFDRERRS